MHTPQAIVVGDSLVCAETGKRFIAARDGCSFNYARSPSGEILSDEGVHLRAVRALRERSRPVAGYLSGDGKHFTGWKGDKLGDVVRETTSRGWHGGAQSCIRVVDVHGGVWHGRGAGRGMSITLRPVKGRAK